MSQPKLKPFEIETETEGTVTIEPNVEYSAQDGANWYYQDNTGRNYYFQTKKSARQFINNHYGNKNGG